MKRTWPMIFILFASTTVLSQDQNTGNERLKIFVDCSNTPCDMAFIKTEINIVDFWSDRLSADLHILVTAHLTGSGGKRYQLIFYGQNRFLGNSDTINYTSTPTATEAEARDLLLQHLKFGLVPFITKTGELSGISIDMKRKAGTGDSSSGPPTEKDPWNYWVFTLNTDGNISAEKSYEQYGYNGNISAHRITEELKLGCSAYGSTNRAAFTFENDSVRERFIARNSYYGFQQYLVKSINDHWSAGYEFIFNNSTFSNYKRQFYLRAAVEYNIFPYGELNNESLTFSYGIISRVNRYYDTTLFNKLKETLFAHSFRGNLALNKKWGTVYSGIYFTNFLQDWKLYSLGVNVNVNVRITGGLSFYVYCAGAITHDQVYLPKSGATEEEVLTRLRQLKSGYNFQNRLGISYRFGSKRNNFVNPRFDGG